MKRIVVTLTAIAALATTAAGAQAAVVYEKGGNIYTASNSGKNSKLLVKGGEPSYTPDGQTVVYTDKNRALFAIPAAGGTPVRLAGTICSVCPGQFSPDSKSLALTNSKGVLSRIPIDGGPAVQLATGVQSLGTFSPDSSQVVFDSSLSGFSELFTVPANGGTPTKLPLEFGAFPLWTSAGIVASSGEFDSTPQAQLVLLYGNGKVKRILTRESFPNEKAYEKDPGSQLAGQVAGTRVVTLEPGKGFSVTLRLISLINGSVKAKRTLNWNTLAGVSADGKRILTLRKGKLQSVSFKTGKRTTLIKTGVKSAYIN